jgi:uracil-DNA glycosylase
LDASRVQKLSASAPELNACRRCDLWKFATQGVPGEGPAKAGLMVVGEQPGDQEDRAGQPFVGPAGRVLDELLLLAGLDRRRLFVTNAVKHFKWEPRGKRRLHRRPNAEEVTACRVWLDVEIASHGPRVIVALGATASRSLTGSAASIQSLRGKLLHHDSGAWLVVTYHPSAILRADESAERMRQALLEDLRRAGQLLAGHDSVRAGAEGQAAPRPRA